MIMRSSLNIVIAGVGGQGTLVAGKLFGTLALRTGADVKVSEVHGMSQRGGSVVTYVKMGKKIYSPVIEKGGADFVLAFEEIEALRYAGFLKKNGKMIVNEKRIEPVTIRISKGKYPDDIVSRLSSSTLEGTEIISVDADRLASEAGNQRSVNMVMAGILSKFTDIEESEWFASIDEIFPGKLREINRNAFLMGRNI